jgi:hypothetical protein
MEISRFGQSIRSPLLLGLVSVVSGCQQTSLVLDVTVPKNGVRGQLTPRSVLVQFGQLWFCL